MLVLWYLLEKDILDQLTTLSGLMTDLHFHLYKNDLIPTEYAAVGDFVEADFTSYAASSAIVWGASIPAPAGGYQCVGDVKQWAPTDSVTPNTIFGVFVTDVGGTVLRYAERFETPVPMASVADSLAYVPVFSSQTAGQ